MSTRGFVNQSVLEGWRDYLEKYRKYIVSGTHFTNFAVQVRERAALASVPNQFMEEVFSVLQEPGGVMILSASFEGHTMPGSSTDFNPYFGTDVGICSIIKPQLSFNRSLDGMPFWAKLFKANNNIRPGSQVRSRGLLFTASPAYS